MPSFAGNQQQDAHEFTRFLLERLRLEFVRGDVLAEKARRAASLSLSAGAKDPLRRNVTPRGREHGEEGGVMHELGIPNPIRRSRSARAGQRVGGKWTDSPGSISPSGASGDASPDVPHGDVEPGESVHFPPVRWPARRLRDRRMGFGMPSSSITPPSSPCSRPRGVTCRRSGSFAPALRLRLAARRAFSASASPRTNSERSRSSRNRVNSCASCCWFPANEGTNVHTARRS